MSVCLQCAFKQGRGFNSISSAAVTIFSSRHFSSTSIRYKKASVQVSSSSTPLSSFSKPTSSLTDKSKPLSSIPAGTPLKGINYISKLSDPIALPDEEYPPWLWTALESRTPPLSSSASTITSEDAADLYSKSKTRRKEASKRIAAKKSGEKIGEVVVPADHRTVDMPFGTFEESREAIDEARRTGRARRRAAIKEKNFLGQLG